MSKKPYSLNVTLPRIFWVQYFLGSRPKAVWTDTVTSPRGCVLSPFLYSFYTNDCIGPSTVTIYYKYFDDIATLGLLTDNYYVIVCHPSISHFTQWWTVSFLELNVDQTKELVMYVAHTSLCGLVPTSISNETVQQVSHSRYLLTLTLTNTLLI